jgi:hypothetical protein
LKKGLLFLFSLVLIGIFASFPSVAAALADPCAAATVIVDVVNIAEIHCLLRRILLKWQAMIWKVAVQLLVTASQNTQASHSGHFRGIGGNRYRGRLIIDSVWSILKYGRRNHGARGVITGAITFDGQKRNDITGTYIFFRLYRDFANLLFSGALTIFFEP